METAALKSPGVFSGPNAIQDFLNPSHQSYTDMVELPTSLNSLAKENVEVHAKLMFSSNPLMNVKSIPVYWMLKCAQDSGKLNGVHTLVEATSGNTGFSLAIYARSFGIKKVKLIVPRDIAPDKLKMLIMVGADIEFSSGDSIKRAKELGQQKGFFNLAQYDNLDNPAGIERFLAPQIWEQTDGKITVFCTGLGTGGTAIGVSNFLRKHDSKAIVVGAILSNDSAVPGVRSWCRLEEVSLDWKKGIDHKLEAHASESYLASLSLIQHGILGGPSSGFALMGLRKFLELKKRDGKLDELRNDQGKVVCVFMCPDTMHPYKEKYSTYLDSKYFDPGSFDPEI